MKRSIVAIVLCAVSFGAAAFDDFEGKYANGNIAIEWRAGGHLGNEFMSSVCPDQKFRPRTHESHSRAGKDYTIKSDFQFKKLEVTGTNKCLPKGTYQRVN